MVLKYEKESKNLKSVRKGEKQMKLNNCAALADPRTWYSLKLGQTINIDCTVSITRVPGGWLLTDRDVLTETFIPFNNEFMNDIKEIEEKEKSK